VATIGKGASLEPGAATKRAGPLRGKGRPLLELCGGYGLILATIWTPRPQQQWLWWISVAWLLATTWVSFPGWKAMGFRRGGFLPSLWVVFAAAAFGVGAVAAAIHLHTLRHPISARGWLLTFGGYTVWSFVQQFLLQGYFLFRLLGLLPKPQWAVLVAAGIFAAAHLPNPILTPITLIWGITACAVFLRYRNVYPLAIAHAILGITVAITVPGPMMHNMRVGLGYFKYHPHGHRDMPGPVLDPPPVRQ
jgi:hypothetical protein